MARYSAGVKTGAGSTLLPLISLFSSVNNQGNVYEVGVTNTSSTAFDVRLVRISSGPGTVGAGLSEAPLDSPSSVANCQAFTTHTAGTPTITDLGYRATIGAAAGAGVIWTFAGEGVELLAAAGTVNGIGVVVENGVGQAAQAYISWYE